MKFTKIALAATLAFVAQAQAATVNLSGASATSLAYVKALNSRCTTGFTVYKTDTTTTALGNVFTAKCGANFTGIAGVDAVAFNVAGGSFTAVSASIGTATAAFANTTGGTAATGTGNLAGIALRTGVGSTSGLKSQGGFLDIEPQAFAQADLDNAGVDLATATDSSKLFPASFTQVFGVAVSSDLYNAMQAAQGKVDGSDDRLPSAQPSISRAAYASLVNDAGLDVKGNPALVINGFPAGQRLVLCRRASTSGTQASSNQFFLNAMTGKDGEIGGALGVASLPDFDDVNSGLTTFDIEEGAGTSDARACLNNTVNGTTRPTVQPASADGKYYAIGVLSMENIPATTGYRYVKLNGTEALDAITTGTDAVASAKAGDYEFRFKSFYFGNTTTAVTVLGAINDSLGANLAGIDGLFSNSESIFSRGASSNAGPLSN